MRSWSFFSYLLHSAVCPMLFPNVPHAACYICALINLPRKQLLVMLHTNNSSHSSNTYKHHANNLSLGNTFQVHVWEAASHVIPKLIGQGWLPASTPPQSYTVKPSTARWIWPWALFGCPTPIKEIRSLSMASCFSSACGRNQWGIHKGNPSRWATSLRNMKAKTKKTSSQDSNKSAATKFLLWRLDYNSEPSFSIGSY